MNDDRLLARLAAANPVPAGAPLRAPAPVRPRRAALALALALAVAIPAGAFAGRLGDLLGISNEGTPVATSSLPLAQVTKLDDALQELGMPSTLQLLGTRDGISFYAARNADGHFCAAIDTGALVGGKGVGCDVADNGFPSPGRPIFDWSRWSHGTQVAGFAADGVASVELYDASGATVATVPVVDNLYAESGLPGGAGLRALDANGNVLYTEPFDEPPPLP